MCAKVRIKKDLTLFNYMLYNTESTLKSAFLYPRRESNPNLKFRKLVFYPLNYKGIFPYKNRAIL